MSPPASQTEVLVSALIHHYPWEKPILSKNACALKQALQTEYQPSCASDAGWFPSSYILGVRSATLEDVEASTSSHSLLMINARESAHKNNSRGNQFLFDPQQSCHKPHQSKIKFEESCATLLLLLDQLLGT